MVIQMQFGNEIEPEKTRTYRDVIAGVNLAQYVEGFYAQRYSYRWGRIVQLIGKERKVIRTFGQQPNEKVVTT